MRGREALEARGEGNINVDAGTRGSVNDRIPLTFNVRCSGRRYRQRHTNTHRQTTQWGREREPSEKQNVKRKTGGERRLRVNRRSRRNLDSSKVERRKLGRVGRAVSVGPDSLFVVRCPRKGNPLYRVREEKRDQAGRNEKKCLRKKVKGWACKKCQTDGNWCGVLPEVVGGHGGWSVGGVLSPTKAFQLYLPSILISRELFALCEGVPPGGGGGV